MKKESVCQMSIVDNASRGALTRIIGTIIIGSGFLVGVLIYLGFYTAGYDIFQKVVVFLVALIVAAAAIAIMWVSWAGRRGWMHYSSGT